MREVGRASGVGYVDDRGPVSLDFTADWIQGGARVMTDVSNFTPVLVNDDRLVGRSGLKVAIAYQLHVPFRLFIPCSGSGGNVALASTATGQGYDRDVRSIRRGGLRHHPGGPHCYQKQR